MHRAAAAWRSEGAEEAAGAAAGTSAPAIPPSPTLPWGVDASGSSAATMLSLPSPADIDPLSGILHSPMTSPGALPLLLANGALPGSLDGLPRIKLQVDGYSARLAEFGLHGSAAALGPLPIADAASRVPAPAAGVPLPPLPEHMDALDAHVADLFSEDDLFVAAELAAAAPPPGYKGRPTNVAAEPEVWANSGGGGGPPPGAPPAPAIAVPRWGLPAQVAAPAAAERGQRDTGSAAVDPASAGAAALAQEHCDAASEALIPDQLLPWLKGPPVGGKAAPILPALPVRHMRVPLLTVHNSAPPVVKDDPGDGDAADLRELHGEADLLAALSANLLAAAEEQAAAEHQQQQGEEEGKEDQEEDEALQQKDGQKEHKQEQKLENFERDVTPIPPHLLNVAGPVDSPEVAATILVACAQGSPPGLAPVEAPAAARQVRQARAARKPRDDMVEDGEIEEGDDEDPVGKRQKAKVRGRGAVKRKDAPAEEGEGADWRPAARPQRRTRLARSGSAAPGDGNGSDGSPGGGEELLDDEDEEPEAEDDDDELFRPRGGGGGHRPVRGARSAAGGHGPTRRLEEARGLTVTSLDTGGYFDMTISAASKALGVGATTLKRICREGGVPRWPYRKRASMRGIVSKADALFRHSPFYQPIMSYLCDRQSELLSDPGGKLEEGLLRLRQHMFKLAFKARQAEGGGSRKRQAAATAAAVAAAAAASARGEAAGAHNAVPGLPELVDPALRQAAIDLCAKFAECFNVAITLPATT